MCHNASRNQLHAFAVHYQMHTGAQLYTLDKSLKQLAFKEVNEDIPQEQRVCELLCVVQGMGNSLGK